MVGSDSTPGRQHLASTTLHPISVVGSGQSGVGMGTILGHFKDTIRLSKIDLGPLAWSKRGACCKIKGGGLVKLATGPPIRMGSDKGLRTKTKPTASTSDPDPALEKRKLVFRYQVWIGLVGVQTKNSLVDAFIGQNNDFTSG